MKKSSVVPYLYPTASPSAVPPPKTLKFVVNEATIFETVRGNFRQPSNFLREYVGERVDVYPLAKSSPVVAAKVDILLPLPPAPPPEHAKSSGKPAQAGRVRCSARSSPSARPQPAAPRQPAPSRSACTNRRRPSWARSSTSASARTTRSATSRSASTAATSSTRSRPSLPFSNGRAMISRPAHSCRSIAAKRCSSTRCRTTSLWAPRSTSWTTARTPCTAPGIFTTITT